MEFHPEWQITMDQREVALARRHTRRKKELLEHTRVLKPLATSQVVMIQNQTGNSPLQWDKSGTVVEVQGFVKYKIKLDGTGRMTTRNRCFLRPITPYTSLPRYAKDDQAMGNEPIAEIETDVQENRTQGSNRMRYGRVNTPPDQFGDQVL